MQLIIAACLALLLSFDRSSAFLLHPSTRRPIAFGTGSSSNNVERTLEASRNTEQIERKLKEEGWELHILSEDPLIYLVPNLLSETECEAYRQYVREDSERPMTRSNPPQVSLNPSKLWPLPLLSLGAGLPPYLRLLGSTSEAGGTSAALEPSEILGAILLNVGVALVAMGALAWLVVLPLVRSRSNASSRTSVATALNLEDDMEMVRPLVDRVCTISFDHPWQCWEAPVVTRYEPGAIFARHGDASPTRGSEWVDLGGQRVVTCICYLNSLKEPPNQGGETYFDQLNLAVTPEEGTALVFFPADANSWKADDRTTHESLPPTTDKWIVQLFGRAKRVPPPLGLPDSFDKMDCKSNSS